MMKTSTRFTRSKMIQDDPRVWRIYVNLILWPFLGCLRDVYLLLKRGCFMPRWVPGLHWEGFWDFQSGVAWKRPIHRQFCHVFPMEDFTLPCLTWGDLQDVRDYENPPEIGSRCGMLVVDVSCFTESFDVFFTALTWSPFAEKSKIRVKLHNLNQFNLYWT